MKRNPSYDCSGEAFCGPAHELMANERPLEDYEKCETARIAKLQVLPLIVGHSYHDATG